MHHPQIQISTKRELLFSVIWVSTGRPWTFMFSNSKTLRKQRSKYPRTSALKLLIAWSGTATKFT